MGLVLRYDAGVRWRDSNRGAMGENCLAKNKGCFMANQKHFSINQVLQTHTKTWKY